MDTPDPAKDAKEVPQEEIDFASQLVFLDNPWHDPSPGLSDDTAWWDALTASAHPTQNSKEPQKQNGRIVGKKQKMERASGPKNAQTGQWGGHE